MNAIFLDIDGVLYPCLNRKNIFQDAMRVRHEWILKGYICEGLSDWDVCAVSLGFQPDAMQFLKCLVEEFDANIIIESSWKFSRSLQTLKTLFALWDIEITDVTSNDAGYRKEPAILEYLRTHPNIHKYVILDDIAMQETFGTHAIQCPDVFNKECYEASRKELMR